MFTRKWMAALLSSTIACAATALASQVSLGQNGWEISTAELGKFTIGYPKIGPDGNRHAPTASEVKENAVSLSYPGGGNLLIEQTSPGIYRLHFTSLPDDAKALRIESTLPKTIKGKASWSIDNKPEQKFLETYGGQPFLFKGDAKRFAVKDSTGDGFAFIAEWGFQQLQDNREWNTDSTVWFMTGDMPGQGEAWMTIKIADSFDGTPMPAAAPAAPVAQAAPAVPAADRKISKPVFSLAEKGPVINAGVAGTINLSLPSLEGAKAAATDIKLSADKKTLTFSYANGGNAQIKLNGEDSITLSFSNLPDAAKAIRMESHLSINYNTGGTYSFDDAAPQQFPREKPTPPFLYHGNAQKVAILHPTGAGFSVSGFPLGTYQQLQDNREWNWSIFVWWFSIPLPEGNPTPSFTLKLDAPAGAATEVKAMIDRYGQHIPKDFPEKVTSDEDLRRDAEEEKEYFASLKPPALDRFGGMPGSGEKYGLKKTGFFHIETVNTASGPIQVLVDPDGNAFFQLGICTFANPCDDYTTVRGRESIYEWLPPRDHPLFGSAWRPNDPGVFSFYLANRVRKYGKPFDHTEFFAESIERVRKWGFNSAGAFTAYPPSIMQLVQERNFPYVTFLPMGDIGKYEITNRVWDPFQPNVEEAFDNAFSRLADKVNDPMLIGYFLTNEPLLEDVPKIVPTLKASKSPAKGRLVQLLQDKYKEISAFNAAWGTNAASFEDLKETPLTIATKQASDDMKEFFELFLETRYSLVNKYFRKYDPNHLLIGDRWMPGTANSEPLIRIASKYYDVLSINYYTYAIEKDYLDRLYKWSGGRPMLFSEFYFACRDQGLSGGGRQMNNQLERGLAYRNYVEQSAALGYVVGIQWFSHIDQAATGRFFEGFNGEAANIGLVNVADRPYKEFLAEAMKTNYSIYDVLFRERPAFAFDDPRFHQKSGGRKVMAINRVTNPIVLDGKRDEWPAFPPTMVGKSGLVLGADTGGLEATFRMAWDDENLYLYAEVKDTTPMNNEADDGSIWLYDSIELFTGYENLDQTGSLQFGDRQILIRGAKAPEGKKGVYFINAPKQYDAQCVVVPGIDGQSYIVEAAIPFEALGFKPRKGQEILFDLCVNDNNGGRVQLAWNGTSQNSKNRGVWGRAELQ